VDDVIKEPEGGAQNDPPAAIKLLDEALCKHLSALRSMPAPELVSARMKKFRNIAQFYTS
jgi:acetyl-CoA carboxylase carboxyl transferase subunit alpha